MPAVAIPDLDASCGRYLKYRDLIECGNTWWKSAGEGALDNRPREAASVVALEALCSQVIDPVIETFGPVSLTYGFASAQLTSKIRGRIAPRLDQHAACETRSDGELVCKRRGAAVDFQVPAHSMEQVARWIAANTAFDRIYFYGDDRPLHVSYGPDQSRAVVALVTGPSGRLLPRALRW